MKSNQITIDVDSGNERTFQVKSHKAGEVMGFPNSEKVDGPHYKHKVFVTDREVTKSFYFYGSIKDYEEGKEWFLRFARLDGKDHDEKKGSKNR